MISEKFKLIPRCEIMLQIGSWLKNSCNRASKELTDLAAPKVGNTSSQNRITSTLRTVCKNSPRNFGF